MRKNRMHIFVLLLVLSLSVSCSRIGAPSDEAIATDIKAKMFSEPALKSAAVDVSSKGGEVTLTGQVPDDAARLAAYKIADPSQGRYQGERSDERGHCFRPPRSRLRRCIRLPLHRRPSRRGSRSQLQSLPRMLKVLLLPRLLRRQQHQRQWPHQRRRLRRNP